MAPTRPSASERFKAREIRHPVRTSPTRSCPALPLHGELQVGDERRGSRRRSTKDQIAPVRAPMVVRLPPLDLAVFSDRRRCCFTNTIEEKSNRIIEVLLSSVSPLQLMVGKILGIAADRAHRSMFSWIVVFRTWAMKFGAERLFGFEPPFDLTLLAHRPRSTCPRSSPTSCWATSSSPRSSSASDRSATA